MYDRFESLCKENGVTPYRVSKATGISTTTFSEWKSGRSHPKDDKIQKIATYFKVSSDYIRGYTDERYPINHEWQEMNEYLDEKEMNKEPDGRWIPLLGNVAAGEPNTMFENVDEYEYVSYETVKNGQYFALRIAGDSMEPQIAKGSIAIVKYQKYADNGDICIVRINGCDATCKKLKKTSNGLILISNNPSYDPMYFSAKEVHSKPVVIIGKVIEVRTQY